ncbi:hypothetical protein RIF29_46987 [Crotalaria pallida]|uniref:Uncharacterized protein n=1 Tax=Crotalaria pallida TaxID=3830 RepID=A0AAN9DS98_CROPI
MLHSLTLLLEKGERTFSILVRKGSSLELSLSSGLLAPYPKPSGMSSIQALPLPQQICGNQRGRRGRWNNVQAMTTQQQQSASQQRQFHSQTYQQSQVQSQPPPQQDSCAPLQLGQQKKYPSSQQDPNQQPHQQSTAPKQPLVTIPSPMVMPIFVVKNPQLSSTTPNISVLEVADSREPLTSSLETTYATPRQAAVGAPIDMAGKPSRRAIPHLARSIPLRLDALCINTRPLCYRQHQSGSATESDDLDDTTSAVSESLLPESLPLESLLPRTFFSAFSNPFGHRFDKIPQPLMFADGVRRQHLKDYPNFDNFICIKCNQHALEYQKWKPSIAGGLGALVAVPVIAQPNRVASLSRAIPVSCEPIGESLHGVPFLPTCERVRLLGVRVRP